VNGGVLAVACTQAGRDGNSIELLSMYKAAGNTGIYPFGRPSMASGQTAKLTGGVDPTSMHSTWIFRRSLWRAAARSG